MSVIVLCFSPDNEKGKNSDAYLRRFDNPDRAARFIEEFEHSEMASVHITGGYPGWAHIVDIAEIPDGDPDLQELIWVREETEEELGVWA